MKSTSRGRAQSWARVVQQERTEPDFLYLEPANEKRQDIIKRSTRINGVVKISKRTKRLHGIS